VTTINVNTIAPAGSTLTVGDSGDTIVAPEVKVNTVKDAGGNTLWVSNGSGVLSSVSGFGGALTLISTQTASSSAYIEFTSGIDSTYKEYIFKFITIHPATDNSELEWNATIDGGSNWDVAKTSAGFQAYHSDGGAGGTLGYTNGLGESTGYQRLENNLGNAADECMGGSLHIFNPSSTTYVKNYYSETNNISSDADNYSQNWFAGGYLNTASAVNGIRFKMSTGNIDAGKIKMYGVS